MNLLKLKNKILSVCLRYVDEPSFLFFIMFIFVFSKAQAYTNSSEIQTSNDTFLYQSDSTQIIYNKEAIYVSKNASIYISKGEHQTFSATKKIKLKNNKKLLATKEKPSKRNATTRKKNNLCTSAEIKQGESNNQKITLASNGLALATETSNNYSFAKAILQDKTYKENINLNKNKRNPYQKYSFSLLKNYSSVFKTRPPPFF